MTEETYPVAYPRPDGHTAVAMSKADEDAYIRAGCERVYPPPPLAPGFPKRLVNPSGQSVVVGCHDQEAVWLGYGFIVIESARP